MADKYQAMTSQTPSELLLPDASACTPQQQSLVGKYEAMPTHMQSILSRLSLLTTEVQADRECNVKMNDTLLNAVQVGDGFLEGKDATEAEAESSELPGLPQSVQAGNGSEPANHQTADAAPAQVTAQDGSENEEESEGGGNIVDWLNQLGRHIKSFTRTPTAGKPSPCPHLCIEPKSYQYVALAKIEHNRDSPLKAILIGDPPGLGKTLPAMMAVVKAKAQARRFSIVVAPASCLAQWKAEFEKFFVADSIKVMILTDANISPVELCKYDAIIVSYHFVMRQYHKAVTYYRKIFQHKETPIGPYPERPSLSLLSDIFFQQPHVKSPYLILDEVTAIKNARSTTFAAISDLRELADTCIMLSGSPVDNTWLDIFAYLQLVRGHSISTRSLMISIFGSEDKNGKVKPPVGNQFRRLLQLLNAFIVRRPASVIGLPPLIEILVDFHLNPDEAAESNTHYLKYIQVAGMNAKEKALIATNDGMPGWKDLTLAMQHACHPQMPLIMHIARDQLEDDNDEASADLLYTAQDIEEWASWKEKLKENDNWKSSRMTALIDTFNESRDSDPDCSVLIFDESVYFLDIVQTAFACMYEPVECLRYDGRQVPEKRGEVLEEFAAAGGRKVLLISRAAGGVGLNITCANVVILCGPWWKKELELQAQGRAHRTGQTRPVTVKKLLATNCMVEGYKAGLRDKKNKHNVKIVDNITRMDGEVPKVWNNLD